MAGILGRRSLTLQSTARDVTTRIALRAPLAVSVAAVAGPYYGDRPPAGYADRDSSSRARVM